MRGFGPRWEGGVQPIGEQRRRLERVQSHQGHLPRAGGSGQRAAVGTVASDRLPQACRAGRGPRTGLWGSCGCLKATARTRLQGPPGAVPRLHQSPRTHTHTHTHTHPARRHPGRPTGALCWGSLTPRSLSGRESAWVSEREGAQGTRANAFASDTPPATGRKGSRRPWPWRTRSRPGPTADQLCGPGQVAQTLWAPVSSLAK